ncbi:MAG: proprotein convertase P-domain-containing protein [Chloroflexi bacterium]|nr:proprotein convertase P-domain-containing protein [Chloroflexota bacterium]OJV89955.1 MAG: hypothetical protein BGO39_34495 [Chloroflexi bacterium 54-19]
MSRIKFKAAVSGLIIFSILFSTNLPLITFAQVADPVVELPGSVAPDLGAPATPPPGKNAPTDPAQVNVVLKPRNDAAFQALAEAVSDPDSPRYQKPMTGAEYRQNYQPDASSISTVKGYFTGQGMTLTYESPSELVMTFKTTLGQRDKAFGTTTEYRTNAQGDSGLINTAPLLLPASVAKNVSGILGFDELHQARVNSVSVKPGAGGSVISRDSVSGVTPAQLRAAYNFPSAYTGAGTKVGIVLWTAPDLNNTNLWKSDNGISGSVTIVDVASTNPQPNSGDLEAHMDIQLVLTAAPATAVRFYVAGSSTFDALGVALQKAVDDNVNAINGSWGNCETNISDSTKASYTTIFQNGAAKGIPFFFSSGDNGVFECNSGGVSQVGFSQFPASDPLVTSVGGTSLDHSGSTWLNETAWSCNSSNDTTCLVSNGGSSTGGKTVSYARPAYQSNITPPTEPKFTNGSANTRLQPDISMNGDPNSGELIYINGCSVSSGTCPQGGGTSASSPLLAGLAALAAQQKGFSPGSSNKFIYRNFPGTWGFDVTSGYNGVTSKPGWDYTTGLGSIKNVTGFLNAFTQPAPFLTASSPVIVEIAGNGNGQVDPGETIGLQIPLTNSGDLAANGVSATLALTGGSATLTGNNSAYPNIAVNGSATNSSYFTFSTSYTLACASVLSFRLTVSYNSGLSYVYTFSLTVGAPVAGTAQTISNSTALPIPDNNALGVTSTITVPSNFTLADVNVTVNVTHTFDSDLILELTGPDNATSVLLASHRGGSGDNYSGTIFDSQAATPISAGTAPFNGSYQPEQSLNAYNNMASGGAWKLNVADTSAADTGTLNSWSVSLKPLTYSCVTYNPVPVLTNISPTSAPMGAAAFTLTLNGSNFVNGAVVRWNGSNRMTTFVNSTQLTAQIPASDLTTFGNYAVTVFNPAPGGGLSGSLPFSVVNPVPVISGVSAPNGTFAGGDNFVLTVNGSKFVRGATVLWQNSPRPTTFVSSSQLTALVSSRDISASGTYAVAVQNPAPGGGTSNAGSLSLVNTTPVISNTIPASVPVNTAFVLTINGSFFVTSPNPTTVLWNGSPHAATYLNNHQLTISLSASDTASTGNKTITVTNPTPGGGSATLSFPVAAGCVPLVVTQTSDGPSSTCGYLRYALAQASMTSPKGAVSLAYTSGQTLTLTTSLSVPVGVSINGFCTASGPGVTIAGTGTGDVVSLNGSSSLYGLFIKGFGGPVVAQFQAFSGGTSANKMACSKISKS